MCQDKEIIDVLPAGAIVEAKGVRIQVVDDVFIALKQSDYIIVHKYADTVRNSYKGDKNEFSGMHER